MKVLLKNEFNRAFKNKWFLITLVICSIIIIYDMCVEIIPTRKSMEIYINTWGYPVPNLYNRWMELNGSTATRIFHLIFPLLVCIPYAGTLYSDVKTKYTYNIVVRANKKDYFLAKLLTQFLVGFVVVMFTLLTSFILTAAILPVGYPFSGLNYMVSGMDIIGKAFYKHPLLISFVVMVVESIIFALIGCISFVFAYILDNEIVVMISPFTLYFFEAVIAPLMGINNRLMESSSVVNLTYNAILQFVLELTFIVLVVLIAYFIRIHKKDEL